MIHATLLIITGLFIGIMNAIVDGGTLIVFPVLIALGFSAISANATSYLAVLPGRLTSSIGYSSYLKKLPNVYVWLLVPAIFGSISGALLLRRTSPDWFQEFLPYLIIISLILLIIQPVVKKRITKTIAPRYKTTLLRFMVLFFILFGISFYGGYFGAGLGFALMALLGFKPEFKMHSLNAIKNIIGLIVSFVAIIVLLDTGYIEWKEGFFLAIGNLVGGYIGARLALKIRSHNIRRAVVVFGLAIVAYLFYIFYMK